MKPFNPKDHVLDIDTQLVSKIETTIVSGNLVEFKDEHIRISERPYKILIVTDCMTKFALSYTLLSGDFTEEEITFIVTNL